MSTSGACLRDTTLCRQLVTRGRKQNFSLQLTDFLSLVNDKTQEHSQLCGFCFTFCPPAFLHFLQCYSLLQAEVFVQCLRSIWIILLMVCFNLWLALKWPSSWTRWSLGLALFCTRAEQKWMKRIQKWEETAPAPEDSAATHKILMLTLPQSSVEVLMAVRNLAGFVAAFLPCSSGLQSWEEGRPQHAAAGHYLQRYWAMLLPEGAEWKELK